MMSKPLTSKSDGSKAEICGGYLDYNDVGCLDKRPDHEDNRGVAVTDKISDLKASSHPNIKLVLKMIILGGPSSLKILQYSSYILHCPLI